MASPQPLGRARWAGRFTVGLKAPAHHLGNDYGAIASFVYAGTLRLQQDAVGG